jgi:acetyl-CoA C-acetyltransferase
MFRVHTAGSVGGSTAIVASQLVSSGIHERVLTVAFEKQSESEAMWALSLPIPFTPPLHAGAGGYFAPHVRSYIRRAKAPDHIGILVALKDRQNGLKNPYAHLHEPDITFDSIKESLMLWDPIRYAETCPSPTARARWCSARRRWPTRPPLRAASRRGCRAPRCARSPPVGRARHRAAPRRCAVRRRRLPQAGITEPSQGRRRGRDVRAVLVVRAHVAGEPRLRRAGRGLEDDRGGRHRARRRPADQPLGRRAVHQPHRASGMLRFGEAAMQVRGTAGDHQVDGVRKAVGHAYGGGSQFFAMWVVGSEKP